MNAETVSVNREQPARVSNGWLGLPVVLLLVLGGPAVLIYSIAAGPTAVGHPYWGLFALGLLMETAGIILSLGLFTLQPNEARVLIRPGWTFAQAAVGAVPAVAVATSGAAGLSTDWMIHEPLGILAPAETPGVADAVAAHTMATGSTNPKKWRIEIGVLTMTPPPAIGAPSPDAVSARVAWRHPRGQPRRGKDLSRHDGARLHEMNICCQL